jgi:hypothetical protein
LRDGQDVQDDALTHLRLNMDKNYLTAQHSIDSISKMSDCEFRVLLYNVMVDVQTRMNKLERQSSWRSVIASVPWMMLTGIIGFLVSGKFPGVG